MKNKELIRKIVLLFQAFLILVSFVASFIGIKSTGFSYMFLSLITLAFITAYGFFLYKKPHGNMLKYAFLLFALTLVIQALQGIYKWNDSFFEPFRQIFMACIIFYTSGRLDRIDENKIIFAVLELAFLVDAAISIAEAVANSGSATYFIGVCKPFIMFATLCAAYFVRYNQHREAGISEAPKADK